MMGYRPKVTSPGPSEGGVINCMVRLGREGVGGYSNHRNVLNYNKPNFVKNGNEICPCGAGGGSLAGHGANEETRLRRMCENCYISFVLIMTDSFANREIGLFL